MLFTFLRQFLRDDEFESYRSELAETRKVLIELKEVLQKQNQLAGKESEKVDPDFLVLIWAYIGVAAAIFWTAIQMMLVLETNRQLPFYIWMLFAVCSAVFIFVNSQFALRLTEQYA